jgi:AAA15 family ATPase/GTPase
MVKKYSKEMPFDRVLLDIIEKASQWKVDNVPEIAKNIIPIIENAIDGTVHIENDVFFILKHNGQKVSFSLEAEGFKKLGLLWQLLMNENLTEKTVLLWDEPDANLNPKLISNTVETILELSRHGMQIFLATHDYNLVKYFSLRKRKHDQVAFYSLYKTENGVACESEDDYDLLEKNSIIEANTKLLEDDIEGVL